MLKIEKFRKKKKKEEITTTPMNEAIELLNPHPSIKIPVEKSIVSIF